MCAGHWPLQFTVNSLWMEATSWIDDRALNAVARFKQSPIQLTYSQLLAPALSLQIELKLVPKVENEESCTGISFHQMHKVKALKTSRWTRHGSQKPKQRLYSTCCQPSAKLLNHRWLYKYYLILLGLFVPFTKALVVLV